VSFRHYCSVCLMYVEQQGKVSSRALQNKAVFGVEYKGGASVCRETSRYGCVATHGD
jgi:hypothetical protein